jgi:hypothetical protein
MRFRIFSCCIFLTYSPFWISAAVTDSAANGFVSKNSVTIQASPEEVYRRIVRNVGDWWDPAHTFSRDAHNLSIEEKPMGCFCEKLPGITGNAGGARHMEVVNFAPGKTLVMSGALGPLQSMAVTANMTIQLTPHVTGTVVDVTYAVTGYLAGGISALAAPVDGVVGQQFIRLKNLIERGSPDKGEGK